MRKKFEEELQHLNNDLVEMGMLLEKSLNKIIHMLEEPSEKIAKQIKGYEKEVNNYERSIQSQALRILFSQQPVARDLRAVSTALNIISDMERISDQACDIAEIALELNRKDILSDQEKIVKMVTKCIVMVNKSVDAFVRKDLDLANEVIDADNRIDELFALVKQDIIAMIGEDNSQAELSIDLLMIAKYLERIADHAVNVAEWVIFNVTGKHKNKRIL